MCGIIGIVNESAVAADLVSGLRTLEYRGYDSSGIATISSHGLQRLRAEGKLAALAERLKTSPLEGNVGIGHTRWATHGAPVERNAHPHATSRVALVHNGIIENHAALRDALLARGATFESDTDTEVIVHLVDEGLALGLEPREAFVRALRSLRGAYAVAAIFRDHGDTLLAARAGSPLVVGVGDHATCVASDAMAIAGLCRRVAHLDEGDVVAIEHGVVTVVARTGRTVDRRFETTRPEAMKSTKDGFQHFMQKEIFEQPTALRAALDAYVAPDGASLLMPAGRVELGRIERINIVACGTSYYAGHAARSLFESIAKIPVELEVASESRYRDAPIDPNAITLVISQSGETADTLAVLRHARARGNRVIAVVNVATSTIAREADLVLPTHAGREVGVASTKAFTTQVLVLSVLAIAIAEARGQLTEGERQERIRLLRDVGDQVESALGLDAMIRRVAAEIVGAEKVLYIGRGASHALALEGALKLKEISYIHAEGFAAGELKHGPLALVDDRTPVVVIAPPDAVFEKTMSNAQEVAARGGRLIVITEQDGVDDASRVARTTLVLPEANVLSRAIVYAVPLQLLAYHVAVLRGTDVDQPRNLAKSVTVE